MKQLFEETTLGRIGVKNRLVRSATFENAGDEAGQYGETMTKIYDHRHGGRQRGRLPEPPDDPGL